MKGTPDPVPIRGAPADWESNGGLVKKLPSIQEDEEGDDEPGTVSGAPRSPLRLGRGLNSPIRSPLLPARVYRGPTEHVRPSSLQIPVVSFSTVPAELSPRFVDGIETENHSNSSQKFDFSPSISPMGPSSPFPGREHSEIKQSVSKLTEEMNSLSRQVSQLSQELQEMTHLLRPLLRLPPIMTSVLTPNLTPPPSGAAQPSASACLSMPAPSATAAKADAAGTLLDAGDTLGMDLPGCLLPTASSALRPPSCSPPSPPPPPPPLQPQYSDRAATTDPCASPRGPPSPGEADPGGSPGLQSLQSLQSLHAGSSNGIFFSSLQDKPPLASRTPSPSLSFSLSVSTSSTSSSSASLSPHRGPHPSPPGSRTSSSSGTEMLPAPLSRDTPPPPPLPAPPPPPPPPFHCSAPPSLNSSPGDRRSRAQGPSAPSTPLNPPAPSALSLHFFSLDSVRERRRGGNGHVPSWSNVAAPPPWCATRTGAPGGQELEMREWAGPGGDEERPPTEHSISFIDEEGHAL
ncbi:unnamed protein product [Merluccius merluccius]